MYKKIRERQPNVKANEDITEQDIQLIIKDVLPRIPYGVECAYWIDDEEGYEDTDNVTGYFSEDATFYFCTTNGNFDVPIKECRPYLYPMLSMTDEHKLEIRKYFRHGLDDIKALETGDEKFLLSLSQDANVSDFLNKWHYDYNGLIDKGLAIECKRNDETKYNPYEW